MYVSAFIDCFYLYHYPNNSVFWFIRMKICFHWLIWQFLNIILYFLSIHISYFLECLFLYILVLWMMLYTILLNYFSSRSSVQYSNILIYVWITCHEWNLANIFPTLRYSCTFNFDSIHLVFYINGFAWSSLCIHKNIQQ